MRAAAWQKAHAVADHQSRLYSSRNEPSKRLLPRQHRLKPAAGSAGAQIVPPWFLNELLVTVDDAQAALDASFGVESPSDACSSVQKQNRDSN